ncbi:TELO2-interacting protein 2 [Patella vulgata]|uniref:TELO2-interacting protein 2 n=1 Tax=Patella vulgata TaxID=6465 RepID=UPI0021806C72|nr:TELO2-interacting protein 2 [Patella vulgata]
MESNSKLLLTNLQTCVNHLAAKNRDPYLAKLNELSSLRPNDLDDFLHENEGEGYKLLADELIKLISLAIIPEFTSREHFIFEASDFKGCSDRTELSLTLLQIVFDKLNNGHNKNRKKLVQLILPDLMILLSSNLEISFWSPAKVVKITELTLEKLKNIFECEDDSLNKLFFPEDYTTALSSVYRQYLMKIKTRLNKSNWMKNPNIQKSFEWMLKQITFPHLSDFIDHVLPPSLNFVDDFNVENKCCGVRCLGHVISNTTREELRWYGRSDVVYDVLQHQLFNHDAKLIQILHPVLLNLLPVFGKLPDPIDNHHKVFNIILRDVEFENNIINRRALTQNLPQFIDILGISIVNHMKKLLQIFETYLEIYDGPAETARLNILKTMQQFILVAWPRIPLYSLYLAKILLKFMYDISCDKSTTPDKVKAVLICEARKCILYLKLCDEQKMTSFLESVESIKLNSVIMSVVSDIKSHDSCESLTLDVDDIRQLLNKVKL